MIVDRPRDFWFRFEPARWRNDEGLRLCSLAARGLWIDMLALMHPQGGYLLIAGKPPEVASLARLVGSTAAEVARLLKELKDAGVSSIDDRGALFSRHMVREITRIETLRSNGKKGGNPALLERRLDNQGGNQPANQDATELEVRDQSKRSESDQNRTRLPPQARDDSFDRFWADYPRKVAKATAERAWKRLKPSVALVEEILAALQKHCQQPQWQRDNGAYIPHPATWLNQRRWEDAIEPSARLEPEHSMAWWDDCKRDHDGQCENRNQHDIRVFRDEQEAADRRVPLEARPIASQRPPMRIAR